MLLSLAALSPLASAAPKLPQAGLIMHLDATLGVQLGNQSISHWWDQSGYGQDLRATGTPKLRMPGLNGKPVIEFDAASDRLRQLRASSLPIHGNDRTLLVLSASTNATASVGYGSGHCGGTFALLHEPEGYTALSDGCASKPLHATGQVSPGQWRLHTLVVNSGTFYHLRDGQLVDGRTSRLQTESGPFQILAPNLKRTKGNLRVAEILAYDRALDARHLRTVQRYLGSKWFNNANYFAAAPQLANLRLPDPELTLSHTTSSKQDLQLQWRVSFADECRADTGWTRSNATTGTQLIRNPQRGANYSLNCWHDNGSATETFRLSKEPLQITWQIPPGQENLITGFRLFLGTRSKRYRQIIKVPANPTNSHTLDLTPGTYYLAMSTIGRRGQESSLSAELQLQVD